MRYALIALTALAGAAFSAPAMALNPQPLPPGYHEPPDPCIAIHAARAHARCVAQQKARIESQAHGSGGGAGKVRTSAY